VKQYRDDGTEPKIEFDFVRLLLWIDHPVDGDRTKVEWVARGTLMVQLNNQCLPVSLTSIKDIVRQVKGVPGFFPPKKTFDA